MELPKLEFWFDYGCCTWVDVGAIDPDRLPISDELKRQLDALVDEFWGYLDWSDPGGPALWTQAHCDDFFDRAELVGQKLEKELRGKYTVISRIDRDRQTYREESEDDRG